MDEDMPAETLSLKCPMCCSNTFNSRQELVEHLTQLLTQLSCPICKQGCQSIEKLVHHLNKNNCNSSDDSSVFENDDTQSSDATQTSATKEFSIETQTSEQNSNTTCLTTEFKQLDENTDVNKMYAELLSRHLTKPDWQSHEVKLLQEKGENHYIFLTQTEVGLDSDTVVTKNNDGTISLTTLKDMKQEAADPLQTNEILSSENDNDKEVYSCNTCGISFTSVMEHIQNYHNDQEVVVEEPVEESSTLDYESAVDVLTQVPKRVITETGNIVEEVQKQDEGEGQVEAATVKEEVGSRKRRYIKVEKLCDSVVVNINENDGKKSAVCHKVVMESLKGSTSKVFHCVNCNLYVSTLKDFKSHPCKRLKYKCPHCSVVYENSKSLCAHMKVHKVIRNEVTVKFVCEICNTTFQTNKSLKLHKRMHDPLKSKPIGAPVSSEGPSNLFLCYICDKLIPVDYRAIHENSHKKDNDKLNCDICNKKFTTPQFLEMHMNVHNMDRITLNNPDKDLPYSCLYCHRKFSRPHEKVKHERIHTGEKPHVCEICGKSFRVSYCLTLHMRTHTGARPYACPHCPKRFKAHSVYNHHILTHSEVRAYKCPFCPKAFKTSVQLAGHKNSHTKPFSCQQCNRPFASLYAVRVHTETHNKQNNLKFSCHQCGASYARASALKDHTKQAHNVKIETELSNTVGQSYKDDWIIEIENQQNTTADAPTAITVMKDTVPIASEAWLNCT